MTTSAEVLFKLLRIAIGTETDFSLPVGIDWREVAELSEKQGVAAVAVDGLQTIYDKCANVELELDSPNLSELKYDWFGQALNYERDYSKKESIIDELSNFLEIEDVKMMVLKGYGLSLNFPTPSHRFSSDIDIYCFGKGNIADDLIKKSTHIAVKQNEEMHSFFLYRGVNVENHSVFLNCKSHPSYKQLECYLERESQQYLKCPEHNFYIPTPQMNSLYLPAHCAGHFFRGEMTIKQLLDFACFTRAFGNKIDWNIVQYFAEDAGYFRFYRCLVGICHSYLGVSSDYLPKWEYHDDMVEYVVNDILSSSAPPQSLIGKSARYIPKIFKYRMVYKGSFFISFFRQSRAYLRRRKGSKYFIWS